MKFKLLKLTLVLFTFLLLIGCSKESQKLPITTSAEKEYTVYADATTAKKDGIKFTATQPWKATVQEVTSKAEDNGRVDWVTLNAYEGEAGEFTLIITLSENLTGSNRKANIIIECGDTRLIFIVEQRGTKQDGSKPEIVNPSGKLIIKIEGCFFYNGEIEGKEYIDFSYDNQGRIIKMFNRIGNENMKFDFTYMKDSIAYELSITENGKDISPKNSGTIVLDDKGRAIRGTAIMYDEEQYNKYISTKYTLSYNTEGYLTDVNGYISGYFTSSSDTISKEDIHKKLTWKDGNLINVKYDYLDLQSPWFGGYYHENEPTIDKAIYDGVPNIANIDLNWMATFRSSGFDFASGDFLNIFARLGYIGKRTKNIVKEIYQGNRVYSRYECVVDKDGYITSITRYVNGLTKETAEYKITYNK